KKDKIELLLKHKIFDKSIIDEFPEVLYDIEDEIDSHKTYMNQAMTLNWDDLVEYEHEYVNFDLSYNSINKYFLNKKVEVDMFSDQILNYLFMQYSEKFGKLYDVYTKKKNIDLNDLSHIYSNDDIKKSKKIIDNCLSDCLKIYEIRYDFDDFNTNFRNLENIFEHIDELNINPLSSKIKNKKIIEYFFKIESLEPTDITFGNDGGCCIAAKSDKSESHIPYYQLDYGTQIIGIYSKTKNSKARRVGMALCFTTIDTENNPTLLINSLELSQKMNPLNDIQLNNLMNYFTEYIQNYTKAYGIKKIALGNHNYNTAKKFLNQNQLIKPNSTDELMKLPDYPEPRFYSEVLNKNGYSSKGNWSYLKLT
ncbi:hypothetical protein HN415_00885, partial [Candidatus Woesearchaeota archaeon]|nr:hypothetical protein [Candidatus Woesearchaeota archaeon]